MEYIISDKTLNKIVNLMEDKPFKIVINLLNAVQEMSITESHCLMDYSGNY